MSTTKDSAQRKAATETGDKRTSFAGSSVELRGSILKDRNTNCLIVHATKTDLGKILPIIRKLDRPSRQILIEAHIVEATSDAARELGVKWGGLKVHLPRTTAPVIREIGSAVTLLILQPIAGMKIIMPLWAML